MNVVLPAISPHCPALQVPLTDEARLALVDAQVQCAVQALASDAAAGTRLGLAAAGALSAEPPGVLSWLPRHHAGRCLFAMRCVQQLASAAAAAGATGSGAMAVVQPLLGRLVEVTDDCLMNISDAEAKGAESGGGGAKLTSWRLRVAMAEAFVLLFRADPRLLGGELLEAFQDFLQVLLGLVWWAGVGRLSVWVLKGARACLCMDVRPKRASASSYADARPFSAYVSMDWAILLVADSAQKEGFSTLTTRLDAVIALPYGHFSRCHGGPSTLPSLALHPCLAGTAKG